MNGEGVSNAGNLRFDESRTDWFLVMREVVVMDPRLRESGRLYTNPRSVDRIGMGQIIAERGAGRNGPCFTLRRLEWKSPHRRAQMGCFKIHHAE